MKKEDFIKKVSELTRIPVKKLTEGFTSEETEVEIEDLVVFTKPELTERDIELGKKAAKTGKEQAVKEIREKLVGENGDDYDFTGKTIENAFEYLKKAATELAKKELSVKPNEALEAEKQKVEKLQKTIEGMEKDWSAKLSEKEKMLDQYISETTVIGAIPSNLDTKLTPKHLANLFKAEGYELTKEDGVQVVKLNGKIVENSTTLKPKTVQEVMGEWLPSIGITPKTTIPGRGKGDQTPSVKTEIAGVKDSASFEKYCEDNEITSMDGKAKALREVQKVNPNFILE